MNSQFKSLKRQNRFATYLVAFCIIWIALILFTFKLPVIPNEKLDAHLGWLTYVGLTITLLYYLFLCKGSRGKAVIFEALQYRCKSFKERLLFVFLTILYTGIFYILGLTFVKIISSSSVFIHGNIVTEQVELLSVSKGQGWYSGYEKVTLKPLREEHTISFYWPSEEVQSFQGTQLLIINMNETFVGTHIESLDRVK